MNHEELKKLAEAATPGPWRVRERKVINSLGAVCGTPVFRPGEHRQSMQNAEYIAAASPDVVLGLLAEIERVKELEVDLLCAKEAVKKFQQLTLDTQKLHKIASNRADRAEKLADTPWEDAVLEAMVRCGMDHGGTKELAEKLARKRHVSFLKIRIEYQEEK